MAQHGAGTRQQSPPPSESKRFHPEEAAEAKERLNQRIMDLLALAAKAPDYVSKATIALDHAKATVRDLFGANSDESSAFRAALRRIQAAPGSLFDDDAPSLYPESEASKDRVQEGIARLENLLEIVDEKTVKRAVLHTPAAAAPLSRRVFLVHGHNEEVKQTVARVLEKLDLQPIILHEQPDQGRTIIEKFEAYADVGFAVVLMTGDDRGGPRAASPDSYQPRARQNVVLEMGFFLGRLGRGQVCVLYEPEVEMPSDYSGVLFKKLDAAGTWKFALAGEIKAAGIDVDVNRLL
jgi:predicted nucleotide-binding protein